MAKLPEAFRPWLHMSVQPECNCRFPGLGGDCDGSCTHPMPTGDEPADPGPSLPVGIPAFHALTVYRLNSGAYQASIMGAKYDGWIVVVEKFANDAISACIKMRFGS